MQLFRLQAVFIDFRNVGIGGTDAYHLGIQIHKGNVLYLVIFENFPDCHAVSASQNEYILPFRKFTHGNMHQRFMIAVFIRRGKLAVSVYIKPHVIPVLRHNYFLILRLLHIDNVVSVQSVFNTVGNIIRKQDTHCHSYSKDTRNHTVNPDVFHPLSKTPQNQHGCYNIQKSAQKRCGKVSQLRQQQQGKCNRTQKTSDIIEAENGGKRNRQVIFVRLNNPCHNGDFRSCQCTDQENFRIHDGSIIADVNIGKKKQKGAYAPNHADT